MLVQSVAIAKAMPKEDTLDFKPATDDFTATKERRTLQ